MRHRDITRELAVGSSALDALDAEFRRMRKWEQITGRGFASEAAKVAGLVSEFSKAQQEKFAIGHSEGIAAAVKSLAADSSVTAAVAGRDTVAATLDRDAVLQFQRAAGLHSPSSTVAQIATAQSASQAVLDHLRIIQSEKISLQQDNIAKMLQAQDTLDKYVNNNFATLDWQRIGGVLGSVDALQKTTEEMLESYRVLSHSSAGLAIGDLSFSLDEFPRIETYAHTNLLRGLGWGGAAKPQEKREKKREQEKEQEQEDPRLREEVAEQSSTNLQNLLTIHYPDLAHMWHGAKAAFHSGNPDYVRQYSSSQRELLLQLLRRTAPDDQVKGWTSEPEHFWNYNANNKPTWRARILYLCDKADRQKFGHFVVVDAESALEIYDRLNDGVHRVAPDFQFREITDLQIRADNLIFFIVLLSLEARN